VNDGSTDPASIHKLDVFRHHPSIRVVDIPNGGVARARNFGVEQVTTEFVALLDADDTVEPDYYSKSIAVLDRYDNVGFIGCWCNDFSDETGKTIRYWVTYNAEPMPNIIMNNTNCQALVYRTDLYKAHGQHDPSLKMYLDDWDGMLGMLEAGCFGVMLPAPLFNYRQRKNSIFSSGRLAWDINYAHIAHKRKTMFSKNAVEMALFLNSNGPNRNYHLLGQPPANETGMVGGNPLFGHAGFRLPWRYRLARSIARKLARYTAKA
jgi:glycosyltransferase involved in cell wall biosynthesis